MIAEGCGKMCTYCVIPYFRCKYRSVPMEKLLSQAEMLARDGVRELILVAQETTLYGTDIYGKKKLPELLRKLCEIDGIEWIRLMYCYPEEITEELIDVMADCDKICKYIDIPIQHSEDKILKRMGRRTTRKELVNLITAIRSRIPDIAIRTTLITGIPGVFFVVFESRLTGLECSHIPLRRELRRQPLRIRFLRILPKAGVMRSWSFSRRYPTTGIRALWESDLRFSLRDILMMEMST